jgi:hypothetical protein
LTELQEDITPGADDEYEYELCEGASWCCGGHDDSETPLVHANEFEGAQGIEADTDAIARLTQNGSDLPVIELAVHDADENEAVIRLDLTQARVLASLLEDLIYHGECG